MYMRLEFFESNPVAPASQTFVLPAKSELQFVKKESMWSPWLYYKDIYFLPNSIERQGQHYRIVNDSTQAYIEDDHTLVVDQTVRYYAFADIEMTRWVHTFWVSIDAIWKNGANIGPNHLFVWVCHVWHNPVQWYMDHYIGHHYWWVWNSSNW